MNNIINHNIGYQLEDKDIIDYQVWTLDKINWAIRGPKPIDINKKYFVSIGAAGTFGRYCQRPYTQQLSETIGINGFNLGVSGAGPSYFNQYKHIFDFINKAEFCIIEIFSGRSIYNDLLELGKNQGQVRYKNSDSIFQMAETIYKEILKDKNLAENIKIQNRINYLNEMKILFNNIKTNKILLYLSTRTPEYEELYTDIKSYWGGFPHFINRDMIKSMNNLCSNYVECVCADGLPYKIKDKIINNYYHSQEMHDYAYKKLYEYTNK
jgi:hypothetical protein